MDPQRYAERYLAPLPVAKSARDVALPELDPHHFTDDAASESPMSLAQLVTAGLDCGHAEARAELKRRSAAADEELARLAANGPRATDALVAELLDATRDLMVLRSRTQSLEADEAALRARVHELESSTIWRLTRPVRVAGSHVKIGAGTARMYWRTLRQLPRYAGVAATILREDGARALAARAARKLRARRGYRAPPATTYALEPAIVPLV
ncbi:MAG TPA: hypothetical protein VG840_01760, partial [Casimicrobiaceae bacterium]|nr:hypothetical protein [Casimicrobiaceae bacterium]